MKIEFHRKFLFHFCTSSILVLLAGEILDAPNNMKIVLPETSACIAEFYYRCYVKSLASNGSNCQVQTV